MKKNPFYFIKDKNLVESLNRDFQELLSLDIMKAPKLFALMCISMTEALLYDFLNNKKILGSQILSNNQGKDKFTFWTLCKIASDNRIVGENCASLLFLGNKYRNLIHPACVTNSNYFLKKEEAEVCLSMLKVILRDLYPENYRKISGKLSESNFNPGILKLRTNNKTEKLPGGQDLKALENQIATNIKNFNYSDIEKQLQEILKPLGELNGKGAKEAEKETDIAKFKEIVKKSAKTYTRDFFRITDQQFNDYQFNKNYENLCESIKEKDDYSKLIFRVQARYLIDWGCGQRRNIDNSFIEKFSAAILKNPYDSIAYFWRGWAYNSQNNFNLAVNDIEKALSLGINPSDLEELAKSKLNLIKIHKDLSSAILGLCDININLYEKPEAELSEQAYSYRKLSAVLDYEKRGILYHTLGKFELALEDYCKLVEIIPGLDFCYFLRATAYLDLGSLELAIKDLDKTIQIFPNFAEAYFMRGIAYAENNNPSQAIKNFNQAIEKDGNFLEAHSKLAYLFVELEDYERAIKHYTYALKIKRNPVYHENRGYCYLSIKQYSKALNDLDLAIELDQNNWEASIFKGKCLESLGYSKEALENYNNSINKWLEINKSFGIEVLPKESNDEMIAAALERIKALELEGW